VKATDILVEEHHVIKKVLECLEKISLEAQEQGKLNLQSAQTAVDFFKNFADLCHHSKEEDRLFPVMEENGFSRDSGPTGVMLREHVAGREHVKAMRESMQKASEGNEEALKVFKENASDFCFLLRDHIQKEDHCLFSMADQAFSDELKENLLNDFRTIELEAGGQRHTKYIQVAQDLCQQYGVEFVAANQLKLISSKF